MKHQDLSITNIKQDKEDVKSLLVMLCNISQNPFERPNLDLSSISIGVTLSKDVILDALNA